MRIRSRLTGLFAVSALSLALTACGKTTNPSPAPAGATTTTVTEAPPADPKEELGAAARRLNETSLKMTLESPGSTSTGSLDPKAKLGEMTMKLDAGGRSAEVQVRTIGTDGYVLAKGVPGVPGGKWMRISLDRLAGSTFDLFPENDPVGVGRLLGALSDVKKDGPGTFSATIDLTKTATNKKEADRMGDAYMALPFSATVDGHGRLATTTIDLSTAADGGGKNTARYFDFGSPVSIEPPPANQTVPAPETVVKLLTG
ncbi:MULTISPECIES: hypothetical protein [Asanoa]|nr:MULTISPECIES: hypothetical protein [Asanoa]